MIGISKGKQFLGLLAWLGITFVAAGVGSAASMNAQTFYLNLARPEWAPPSSVFGPVWTVLYVLMAVAAWLVWRIDGFHTARKALTLFVIQLAINALWSWLFFGWQQGAAAFAGVLFLWALILATVIAFWRLRPLAGFLLIPYLLWVSFASVLNYVIWQLNPQVLG